jgi:hypothetical protein
MPKVEEFCLFYMVPHAKPQRRQAFFKKIILCALASLREQNNNDPIPILILAHLLLRHFLQVKTAPSALKCILRWVLHRYNSKHQKAVGLAEINFY